MNSSVPSTQVRPLQSFRFIEFRVSDGSIACENASDEDPDELKELMNQFDKHVELPFDGLIASFPLDGESYVFGLASRDSTGARRLRCHFVPKENLVQVITDLMSSRILPQIAPTVGQLDKVEPVLRCSTSGQRMILAGCTPSETMTPVWEMTPSSCWQELTFAAPPFASNGRLIYFCDHFDMSRLGKDAPTVILDLSEACHVDTNNLNWGWSVVVHSQIVDSVNPRESLRNFFDTYCHSATLAQLESIAQQWCIADDIAVGSADPLREQLQFVESTQIPTIPSFVIPVATEVETNVEVTNDGLIDQLGQLDDAVFDAIAGSAEGLERMRELWPNAKTEIAPHLIDESREHYMRYMVNEWTQRFSDASDVQKTCLPSLEVIRILFEND